MVSKKVLATVTGGLMVAATTLFYLYEVLARGAGEQAVTHAALVAATAFVGAMIYEDWKDAKRNAENNNRNEV